MTEIVELKVRQEEFERRIGVMETSIKENLGRIYTKLDTIGQRPTWGIAMAFTVMTSLLVALIVFVLTSLTK